MFRNFKSRWSNKFRSHTPCSNMDNEPGEIPNQEITPSADDLDVKDVESIPSEEEEEEDDEDDIDKMLSDLQGFQEELEQQSQKVIDDSNFMITPPPKSLDEFRFSMSAMEDTGEVDLDALLEDLCIMEKDLNSNNSTINTDSTFMDQSYSTKPNSPLSPKVKVPADVRSRLESVQEENKELTLEEQQERIKAEKIRIALEKLRAARVKKLVVKVHNDEDPTSKTIAIDQTWTSWEVSKKMMIKNDAEPDPNWALIERLSDLCIERSIEDHESVVDVVSNWPWENNNRIVINNKRDKYALFRNPQNYLLSSDTSAGAAQLAEKSKDILLQEHFQPDAMRLPELDGVLYLKEGKKSWKKHYFCLRASGIYYTPKGKTKTSRDLVCLVKFEYVLVYTGGAQFKKKFKAPTEHCFVLKHPEYHDIDSKAIKYLCADDQKTLQRWTVCIKLAKYGYQMLEDYATTQDEMDRLAFTLDKNRFTKAASFSAGQKTDDNVPQITAARDKAVQAKVQSDRLKTALGPNPAGSQSFSVSRKQSTEKRQQKKNIGNLFSDAWKKGTEPEETAFVPISPNTPSGGDPSMTPNTFEPKSFHLDNEVSMDHILEEMPPSPPLTKLELDAPPISSRNSSKSNSLERENIENTENCDEHDDRIPSPTEIKTMLEALPSLAAPPLSHKGVSMLPAPAPAPLLHDPLPPPPVDSFAPAPVDSFAPAPPMALYEAPRSPSGSLTQPSPSSPNPSSFCSSPRSPPPAAFGAWAEPPLPPPPVARKPSRSNSVLSQKSMDEGSPMVDDEDPSNDETADFPPPPPLPFDSSAPPPVKRKPSRSGSITGNGVGNGNNKITRVAEMGSTDSLDNIPPPPPLEMPLASDDELPPPPPEVVFKNHLESSLMRSNSNNRDRANSNGKPCPPPPPPKKGRPRLTSNGHGPPSS